MEIHLTPEESSFIENGIGEGRFSHPEEAVKDALALWVRRERARSELLMEIEAGAASFNGTEIILEDEDSIAVWKASVKQRGLAKLAGI